MDEEEVEWSDMTDEELIKELRQRQIDDQGVEDMAIVLDALTEGVARLLERTKKRGRPRKRR
jgi:hypothetical protein